MFYIFCINSQNFLAFFHKKAVIEKNFCIFAKILKGKIYGTKQIRLLLVRYMGYG